MTWKDKLTESERADLDRLEKLREQARVDFNAMRRKLQSRCESRMRQEAKRAAALRAK